MDVSKLKATGACLEAVRWAEGQPDGTTAWSVCERGDWMLWLLGKLLGKPWSEGKKPLVLTACECARLSLPYTKDPRVLKCIETAEAWTRGEVRIEQVRSARAASCAAVYAAAADADAAAADADAARKKILAQCAGIVRKHYPIAPILEGGDV